MTKNLEALDIFYKLLVHAWSAARGWGGGVREGGREEWLDYATLG